MFGSIKHTRCTVVTIRALRILYSHVSISLVLNVIWFISLPICTHLFTPIHVCSDSNPRTFYSFSLSVVWFLASLHCILAVWIIAINVTHFSTCISPQELRTSFARSVSTSWVIGQKDGLFLHRGATYPTIHIIHNLFVRRTLVCSYPTPHASQDVIRLVLQNRRRMYLAEIIEQELAWSSNSMWESRMWRGWIVAPPGRMHLLVPCLGLLMMSCSSIEVTRIRLYTSFITYSYDVL
jgi:hypothetical protein